MIGPQLQTHRPKMGKQTASKNTFTVLTKVVHLTSFNIPNFPWTSTLPRTYWHTNSASGQMHTSLLCFLLTRIYTHIHIYMYVGFIQLFTPFVLTTNTRTYWYHQTTNTYIRIILFTNPFARAGYDTKSIFLSGVWQVWIQSFPPRLVASPRLKNPVCPTIYP